MPAEAKRKGPSAKAKIKRSNTPNPYGCSGYGDKCLERKNRQWRSKFEFWLHFATHLKDSEALDGYICLQCGMESQSPDVVCTATEKYSHGRELAMHIWFEHMIPSTRPKRPQGAASAAVDGRKQRLDILRDWRNDTKQEHQSLGVVVGTGNGNRAGETSSIQHDQPGESRCDFLWAADGDAYNTNTASST